jgi:hypothetical protein
LSRCRGREGAGDAEGRDSGAAHGGGFARPAVHDGEHLRDPRRGKNTQLPLPDPLRQAVYSRRAGYDDVNDAERLS